MRVKKNVFLQIFTNHRRCAFAQNGPYNCMHDMHLCACDVPVFFYDCNFTETPVYGILKTLSCCLSSMFLLFYHRYKERHQMQMFGRGLVAGIDLKVMSCQLL